MHWPYRRLSPKPRGLMGDSLESGTYLDKGHEICGLEEVWRLELQRPQGAVGLDSPGESLQNGLERLAAQGDLRHPDDEAFQVLVV